MPPALQSLLGFLTGLALTALTLLAVLFDIPVPLAAWLVLFAVLWVGVYLAIRRHLTVLVVATFLTGGIASMWIHQLFARPPHTPSTHPTPTAIPAD